MKRVSEDTSVSYSTLRDFTSAGAGLSIDRASQLADYLGLELTTSKLRKQEMKDYEKMITRLEASGHAVDEESIKAVTAMAEGIKWLNANGWEEFDLEAAQTIADAASNMQWLAENGWEEFDEEDAAVASSFVSDVKRLAELGWESFDSDDATAVGEMVANLQWLEARGEEATPERIEEVAQLRANLEAME